MSLGHQGVKIRAKKVLKHFWNSNYPFWTLFYYIVSFFGTNKRLDKQYYF